ncbi:hypothetical protein JOB18_032815, partial [Solea senegalensis]
AEPSSSYYSSVVADDPIHNHQTNEDGGERMQECHRVVTMVIVKDLQPFATVKSKWCR